MSGTLLGIGNPEVNMILNVLVLIKFTLLKGRSGSFVFFFKEFIRLR